MQGLPSQTTQGEINKTFLSVFDELFNSLASDILDPEEICPFSLAAVVYPSNPHVLFNMG